MSAIWKPSMCQFLVLVWLWFGLLCQCPLSVAVQIPCSQLWSAILAAVRRSSPDKGLSGENAVLRITLAMRGPGDGARVHIAENNLCYKGGFFLLIAQMDAHF